MSVKNLVIVLLSSILLLTTAPIADAGTEDDGLSRDKVRQIQTSLKDAGFDPGPIDGIVGPRTKKAVRSFQYDTGILATGNLNEETEITLGTKESMPTGLARVEESDAAQPAIDTKEEIIREKPISNIEDVKQIQMALQDLEYNPGEINGMMSSETQQAVREFQLLNGFMVTGTVDEQTKTAVLAAAGKESQ